MPGVGGELVHATGSEDTFKIRHLNDGSTHRVIKNYYDEDELRRMLRPHCSDCEVHCGSAYWWVRYSVR